MVNKEDYQTKVLLLEGRFNALQGDAPRNASQNQICEINYKIRVLHAEIELFEIELDELREKCLKSPKDITSSEELLDEPSSDIEISEIDLLINKLTEMSSKLHVKYYKPSNSSAYMIFYELLRLFCTLTFLVVASTLSPFPTIAIREFDKYCIRNGYMKKTYSLACLIKIFIGLTVCKVSGNQHALN